MSFERRERNLIVEFRPLRMAIPPGLKMRGTSACIAVMASGLMFATSKSQPRPDTSLEPVNAAMLCCAAISEAP